MANDYRAYVECDYNSIYHYGIKGTKWGVRRYQNEDGSLTPEGRAHYNATAKAKGGVKPSKKRKRIEDDETTQGKKVGTSTAATEMYKALKRGTLKEDLEDYYKNAESKGKRTEDFGSYKSRINGHRTPIKKTRSTTDSQTKAEAAKKKKKTKKTKTKRRVVNG